MPIYPASEPEISGITSERLAKDINKLHPDLVQILKDDDELNEIINKKYSKKSTILVLGAGSIGRRVKKCLD